ncbi:hypothetical protein [Nostoc commune]|uniref:hypothetical protein n=1 Tax=Nostoc commune TaxID=1178 RepID=UPI0018C56FBB|nr:hypothetical protein [Nostoc commune]MBG1258821.1 hypothetical protein [Nostoc commune BAE]
MWALAKQIIHRQPKAIATFTQLPRYDFIIVRGRSLNKQIMQQQLKAIATFTQLPRYDFMIVCGRSLRLRN